MRQLFSSMLIACLLAVGLFGCGGSRQAPSPAATDTVSPMDTKRSDFHAMAGLIDSLEREGLRVEESTSSTDPGVFSGEGTYYALSADGGAVRVWLFDTSEALEEAAARISEDGSRFRSPQGETNVSWVGWPRFFKTPNMIVLYLEQVSEPRVDPETDAKVMRALTSLMGERFAGTP